jgi:ABC-type Mn2+/Zn2+ transport system permease subunit
MDLDPLRVLERVHGHAGWLTAALLVHPAVVLRDRKRQANLAVALATALTTGVAALGLYLYVSYREQLKKSIFLGAPDVGFLFERKEHLAFGAVMLAWAGCAAYFAAARTDPGLRNTLRTIAFRAFVASATLATIVASLGTYVAIYKSF